MKRTFRGTKTPLLGYRRSGRGPWNSRSPWLCALTVFSSVMAAADSVDLGVQVPNHSRKVAERRYRSSEDFEGTLKFYKTAYPPANYPRKTIVNKPGVRGVHIVNPRPKGWEGVNIYEANDEVRIYIVAVDAPGKSGQEKAP